MNTQQPFFTIQTGNPKRNWNRTAENINFSLHLIIESAYQREKDQTWHDKQNIPDYHDEEVPTLQANLGRTIRWTEFLTSWYYMKMLIVQ